MFINTCNKYLCRLNVEEDERHDWALGIQWAWLFGDGLHVTQVIGVHVFLADVTLCFATLVRMFVPFVQDLATLTAFDL